MKSLWKYLVHSSFIIGVSASLSASAIAQDDVGIVRISKPSTADVTRGRIIPVSAMQADGNCINATPGMSGNFDPTMGMSADMMGACDGNCRRGLRRCNRRDWQNSGWQADGYCWGSDFHARTYRHSLAVEQCFARATGHTPSTYYHDQSGNDMISYLQCKFGYFIPTGGGGQGVPWVGHYKRTYPVDPYYSDPRDGQAYAAQGYGIPMSVPLAPVVSHTYDYGWGMPSSRLTPISRPAY